MAAWAKEWEFTKQNKIKQTKGSVEDIKEVFLYLKTKHLMEKNMKQEER